MARRRKEDEFNPKFILELIGELKNSKKVTDDVVYTALEFAVAKAVARQFEYETDPEVKIDRETYEMVYFETDIEEVEEEVFDEELEEMVVKKVERKFIVTGEPIPIDLRKLGRIATQIAKQVMIQKLREAEWEILFDEYSKLKKQLITAEVMNMDEKGNLHLQLDKGRAEAIMLRKEQIQTEQYIREGEGGKPILALILDVKKESKKKDGRKNASRLKIILSRAHKDFVSRLFEREVPEIKNNIVQIKSIARRAGIRTKLAVISNDSKVDAVGACVGTKGSRINKITAELNNEKIDVIHWSDDIETLIFNALKPAKVSTITLDYDRRSATVVVPDDELKLAIGKNGINVNLATELSGWKLDIITTSQEGELGVRAIAKFLTVDKVNYQLAKQLFDIGLTKFDEILETPPEQLDEIVKHHSFENGKELHDKIIDLSEEEYFAEPTQEQLEHIKKLETENKSKNEIEEANEKLRKKSRSKRSKQVQPESENPSE